MLTYVKSNIKVYYHEIRKHNLKDKTRSRTDFVNSLEVRNGNAKYREIYYERTTA